MEVKVGDWVKMGETVNHGGDQIAVEGGIYRVDAIDRDGDLWLSPSGARMCVGQHRSHMIIISSTPEDTALTDEDEEYMEAAFGPEGVPSPPTSEVPEEMSLSTPPPPGVFPLGDRLVTTPTGAVRESKEGRGRPDLLLAGFPRALTALCGHVDCPLGRERNWEKGLPESSLISSMFRHLLGYTSGTSEDTPEYNLIAMTWNALVLLEEYLRVQEGVMDKEVLDVRKEIKDV